MPTHLPVWIEPMTFVQKLIEYQKAGVEPINMDLQLAIQRCALEENTEEALQLAEQSLEGEYKDLICFLLNKEAPLIGKTEHQAWWLTAAITRWPGTKFSQFDKFKYKYVPKEYIYVDYQWETYIEEYLAYGEYNREKKEYNRYTDYRPNIRQLVPEYKPTKINSDWFMEYSFDMARYDNIEYLLYAYPNTPDNIYKCIGIYLSHWGGTAWEVSEQIMARKAISVFQELNTPLREMHYLFLSTCLLAGDKTVRDYAYHIWTERVATGSIDNKILGSIIGRLEIYELCPFKRLADLMSSSMMGISPLHNRALQELIEAIIPQLLKPIANLKKLLEIYTELLALNNSMPSSQIKDKLNLWKDNSTLKKIIKQLTQ